MTKVQILFSFVGSVIPGNQIGRKLGFPTANLSVHPDRVCLDHGVYGVKLYLDNQKYYGVINIGVKPTINNEDKWVSYEVHIFDFDGNIYGKSAEVDICFFIREEISFTTIDQLILQIEKNIEVAKRRFHLSLESLTQ